MYLICQQSINYKKVMLALPKLVKTLQIKCKAKRCATIISRPTCWIRVVKECTVEGWGGRPSQRVKSRQTPLTSTGNSRLTYRKIRVRKRLTYKCELEPSSVEERTRNSSWTVRTPCPPWWRRLRYCIDLWSAPRPRAVIDIERWVSRYLRCRRSAVVVISCQQLILLTLSYCCEW